MNVPDQGVAPAVLDTVARAAARHAGGLDPALLGDLLPILVTAVANGTRVRRRDLTRFADTGRHAASRGVPLRALIDLQLTASWQLWPHLPAVALVESGAPVTDPPGRQPAVAAVESAAPVADPPGREPAVAAEVARAGAVMLRAVAEVTAALTEGYQLARRELVRAQVAARQEFVDDLLLGGTYAMAGLVDRAAGFGLDLAGPHAVVVVDAEKPFTDTSPLTGVLERSLHGAKADADAWVATQHGRLVVVFAAPDRAAITFVVDRLSAALPAAPAGGAPVRLERTAAVGEWRMGVGRAHSGPVGIRLSYDDALEALELGSRLDTRSSRSAATDQQRIFDAADLLVHRVLIRDEPAMRDLVNAVLEPLQGARGGAEPLVRTLEAYFAAGGNTAAAARALHLSVRALTYRLARIAALTGHDPANPADRFTLQAAVIGARLMGSDGTGTPAPPTRR